jgi:hypothetical protein
MHLEGLVQLKKSTSTGLEPAAFLPQPTMLLYVPFYEV